MERIEWVPLGLWALALALPAYVPVSGPPGPTVRGLECFLIGAMTSPLAAVFTVVHLPNILGGFAAWFANPMLVVSLQRVREGKAETTATKVWLGIGLALSLSALAFRTNPLDLERGSATVYRPGAGAYTWIGAFVFAAALRIRGALRR